MTRMNLTEVRIRRALEGVVSENQLENSVWAEDAIAKVALSVITEPGDRFAGWLAARYRPSEIIETFQNGFAYRSLLNKDAFDQLRTKFGNVESLLADATERWQPRLAFSAVEQALAHARRIGAKLLFSDSEHWPLGFDDLAEAAPHVIWLRGSAKVLALADRSIAVVGSRLASGYGEHATNEIVSAAVAENMAVISGGAYGIDAIAHRATLALDGFTVAVLAGGIDRLYPAGNYELLSEIAVSNALISEQPPGSSPTKWRFLQRNRLIAALGQATVIVEAGTRSGALNTATHAEKLDRPIGAIPGRFDSPQSAGCHELIRNGQAILIANPGQAIELALPNLSHSQFASAPILGESLGSFETRALDALTARATTQDRLAAKAGMTIAEVAMGLGGLEMKGLAVKNARGWVKARKQASAN